MVPFGEKRLPEFLLAELCFLKKLFNELKLLNIPVISLTNNLSFTNKVDYPVLCNNEDPLFIKFFLFLLKGCVLKGQARFTSKFNIRKLSTYEQKSFLKLILNKNAK